MLQVAVFILECLGTCLSVTTVCLQECFAGSCRRELRREQLRGIAQLPCDAQGDTPVMAKFSAWPLPGTYSQYMHPKINHMRQHP